jgi:diguanylate cyclase (GGDEF)-like protein
LRQVVEYRVANGECGGKKVEEVLDSIRRSMAASSQFVTIARLGGDEFAVVQAGMQQPSNAAAQARRLIEAMSRPFEINGHQVVVGTSIGIAVGPGDGMTAEQLIKNADLALYTAKGTAAARWASSNRKWRHTSCRGAKWNATCARRSGDTSSYSSINRSSTSSR